MRGSSAPRSVSGAAAGAIGGHERQRDRCADQRDGQHHGIPRRSSSPTRGCIRTGPAAGAARRLVSSTVTLAWPPRETPSAPTAHRAFAAQRRALPDAPGVYLFRDTAAARALRGQGEVDQKRVAVHFSQAGHAAAPTTCSTQIANIEFVATQTEAEALLAEQNFIKRHRPRFNVRLRDDKSYPYIAISLDEDFPRVYFTREKHRRNRAYFGPFSNAKRVRETLDLLGKVFQYRTCDGAEPGRASGSPCLDYFIKRCQAPCVGYVSQGGVPREHRDDRRLPLGPLPPDRARPRGDDEARGRRRPGVRAAPPRCATG